MSEKTLTREEIISFLDDLLDEVRDPTGSPTTAENIMEETGLPYIPESGEAFYQWILKYTWNNLPDVYEEDSPDQLWLFGKPKIEHVGSLYVTRCGECEEIMLENDKGTYLERLGSVGYVYYSDEMCLEGENIVLCEPCYETESMHLQKYEIYAYEDDCDTPVSYGYVGKYMSNIEEVYDVFNYVMIDENYGKIVVAEEGVNLTVELNTDIDMIKERASLRPIPTTLYQIDDMLVIDAEKFDEFVEWYYNMKKCEECSLFLHDQVFCCVGGPCIKWPEYNPDNEDLKLHISQKLNPQY